MMQTSNDAFQSRFSLPNLSRFPMKTARARIPIRLRWMFARMLGAHETKYETKWGARDPYD